MLATRRSGSRLDHAVQSAHPHAARVLMGETNMSENENDARQKKKGMKERAMGNGDYEKGDHSGKGPEPRFEF